MSLHALSGCDSTDRLLGKRKKSWMTAFIECTEKELEALLSLQTEYPLVHIAELEELICKLYSKNEYVKTFAVARYHVYTQNGHQTGKLPPTSSTFKQVALRAHCQLRAWALSDVSIQTLPNPEDCGWYLADGTFYMPETYDGKIAPDDIMMLIRSKRTL